jgi:hypothetical protein
MRAADVERWVRRKALLGTLAHALLALLCLVGGAAAVLIMFCITYVVIFIFNWYLPHSHATRWRISLAFVGLLFVAHLWESRKRAVEPAVAPTSDSDEVYLVDVSALMRFADISRESPPPLRTEVRFLVHALCTGPRILLGTASHLHAAYRLARLDVQGCAAVVALLLEAEVKVPFPRIRSQLPGLDFARVLPDLRRLGGVLFLVKPPEGLLLSSMAMAELKGDS